MAYDKQYYQNKLFDLDKKSQTNLQEYIQNGFKMVEVAKDIEERKKEIMELMQEKEKELKEVQRDNPIEEVKPTPTE